MTHRSPFKDDRGIVNPGSCRDASFVPFATGEPQHVEPGGAQTWIARGAHFVVAVTPVQPGDIVVQANIPDESFLLLSPAIPVTISTDVGSEEVDEEAVAILPPGNARLTARGTGMLVRIFSIGAAELAGLAGNAAAYADNIADVAPLVAWPDPVGGFRLRVYRLRDHSEDVGFGRLFRSTNLMVNIFEPSSAARDPAQLSPHDHADFEQGSLTLAGDFTHYLRTPWGPDSSRWRADRTVRCSGLSLIVIPPKMIHTTSWSAPGARLVDIFSPPRLDFSLKPRWVRNADDYPLPNSIGKGPSGAPPPRG